ncbi:MAG: glycosyl hydrolase family 65 protein [Microbacterium sp.]|uniref:glycoside hydrolase family 65 protein n=1 Tax=Microbacterium sp. TaxID=51671 RepID=UPI0039E712ED
MDLSTLDDEWTIRQSGFDRDKANASETLFTVGNGRMAARGTLEEGHRGAVSGSYIAGVYDGHDSIVVDMVNVPDWIDTAVYANGTRLDVDTCTVVSHDRALDIAGGVLWRSTVFEDADGRRTRLDSLRTASMADRDIAVVRVEATPLNYSGELEVVTGIDGDRFNMEALPVYPKGRTFTTEQKWAKWARSRHLATQSTGGADGTLTLATRTLGSGIDLAFATVAEVSPAPSRAEVVRSADAVRQRTVSSVAEGETVRLDKIVAVRTSRDVDAVDGEDLVARASAAARAAAGSGVDTILAASAEAWQRLWDSTDAEVVGDDKLALAVRSSIYHLLITANPDDPTVNIGAKSMSGEGYRGHVFWDTEVVMLPFYVLTQPATARALLGYRHHTLEGSKRYAAAGGYEGARVAWESALTGDEECPKWSADGEIRIWTGDEEVHISSDVAYGIRRYLDATEDREFLWEAGAELLFETSRFWTSYGQTDDDGSVHYRQVMGPDEFHFHVDDNAFTNVIVAWHLRYAADTFEEMAAEDAARFAALAGRLGLAADTPAQWREYADRIVQPVKNDDGVIEQFAGYFDRDDVPITQWDENLMPIWPEGYDDVKADETQMLKQPDVVQLMLMFPDEFDKESRLVNYDYYEPRTMHKSSLSPSVHATMGLTVGDHTRALQYFTRSALVDIADNQGNTCDGMHIASAAGTWSVLVNGFGGLEVRGTDLFIDPWVPPEWDALRYRFHWRDLALRVHVDHSEVRVETLGPDGATLPITIAGNEVVLAAGETTVVPLG